MRQHVLADEPQRPHDHLVRNTAGLLEEDDLAHSRSLELLELADDVIRIADNNHVVISQSKRRGVCATCSGRRLCLRRSMVLRPILLPVLCTGSFRHPDEQVRLGWATEWEDLEARTWCVIGGSGCSWSMMVKNRCWNAIR
jgi:hypothetical protein